MTAAVKNNLLIGAAAAGVLWFVHKRKDVKTGAYGIGAIDKNKQLQIILANNPANDNPLYFSTHTWVRTVDDILTYPEALEYDGDFSDGYTPDYTAKDIERALNSGKITVYSSYPIESGIFVTPSKIEAQNYAGGGKVYSKKVNLSDVAWIDGLQGQYAPVSGIGKVD